MTDFRKWRKGAGKGWRGEYSRHSLAARGIKTRGLSSKQAKKAVEMSLFMGKKRKQIIKGIGKNLTIMRRYAEFQRLGKGYGRYITEEDYKRARASILSLNPNNKKVKTIDRQLQFYKKTHHVPMASIIKYKKIAKLRRAKIRKEEKVIVAMHNREISAQNKLAKQEDLAKERVDLGVDLQ